MTVLRPLALALALSACGSQQDESRESTSGAISCEAIATCGCPIGCGNVRARGDGTFEIVETLGSVEAGTVLRRAGDGLPLEQDRLPCEETCRRAPAPVRSLGRILHASRVTASS